MSEISEMYCSLLSDHYIGSSEWVDKGKISDTAMYQIVHLNIQILKKKLYVDCMLTILQHIL